MFIGSIMFGFLVIFSGYFIAHKIREKELHNLKESLCVFEVELLKMERRGASIKSLQKIKEDIEVIRALIKKLS